MTNHFAAHPNNHSTSNPADGTTNGSASSTTDTPAKRGISRRTFLRGAGIMAASAAAMGALSGCSSEQSDSANDTATKSSAENTATSAFATGLAPTMLGNNLVEPNPYMAEGEAIIHNDCYSSDVTSKPVPLGIYSEVTAAAEGEADKAIPCFFYDSAGHCITPYSLVTAEATISGGIAIRDINANPVKTLGRFLPALDDSEPYGIQISYSFVDNNGFVVGATTHGHILMVRTTTQDGSVLSTFTKVLDVDVLSIARNQLGEDIDPNLLSVIMDYSGNLWFTTGGFHIDPAYASDGFVGYITREYIDKTIAGQWARDTQHVFTMRLGKGESAENGISSHPAGCVILTNQACYLFNATHDGVHAVWRTEYECDGGKGPISTDEKTGAGLAWGSGTTPTLSQELCLFTDNQTPINLIALNINTGKVVAQTPVFSGLDSGVMVSVENSILVYSESPQRVSILVCNWYGAGNEALWSADADSSVQSYDNLYDQGWIEKGNKSLMPGVERIDVTHSGNNYNMKSVWMRPDIFSTCMFKLSTATGYLYGYTQIDEEWSFIALNWDDGKIAYKKPVSPDAVYNNMAVGMMQGNNGNTLYVPTNNLQLLRLQDRFAYLPNRTFERLNIDTMNREYISRAALQATHEIEYAPATLLHTVTVPCATQNTLLAVRVNGLWGNVSDLHLLYRKPDGTYAEWPNDQWSLADSNGEILSGNTRFNSLEAIYEVRFYVHAKGDYNTSGSERDVRISLLLAI